MLSVSAFVCFFFCNLFYVCVCDCANVYSITPFAHQLFSSSLPPPPHRCALLLAISYYG